MPKITEGPNNTTIITLDSSDSAMVFPSSGQCVTVYGNSPESETYNAILWTLTSLFESGDESFVAYLKSKYVQLKLQQDLGPGVQVMTLGDLLKKASDLDPFEVPHPYFHTQQVKTSISKLTSLGYLAPSAIYPNELTTTTLGKNLLSKILSSAQESIQAPQKIKTYIKPADTIISLLKSHNCGVDQKGAWYKYEKDRNGIDSKIKYLFTPEMYQYCGKPLSLSPDHLDWHEDMLEEKEV